LRDAGDAQIEIEETLTAPATTSFTGDEQSQKATRVQKLWFVISAVFFLTTIALASVLIYNHRPPSESVAVRF